MPGRGLRRRIPQPLGGAVLRSAEQLRVGRERSRLVAALHLHARFGSGCGSPRAQVHAQPVCISLDCRRAPRGRPVLIGRVGDRARGASDRGGGNVLLELRDPVGQIGGLRHPPDRRLQIPDAPLEGREAVGRGGRRRDLGRRSWRRGREARGGRRFHHVDLAAPIAGDEKGRAVLAPLAHGADELHHCVLHADDVVHGTAQRGAHDVADELIGAVSRGELQRVLGRLDADAAREPAGGEQRRALEIPRQRRFDLERHLDHASVGPRHQFHAEHPVILRRIPSRAHARTS